MRCAPLDRARGSDVRARREVSAGRFRRCSLRCAAGVAARSAGCATGDQDTGAAAAAAAAPRALSYDWHAQWYALAVVDDLDAARPHRAKLLGEELVLWKDGRGAWRCFQDACPHRLAPLSEGRVEADGTLLCSYHAWRFDGSGSCTAVPQAEPQAEQAAAAHPRACVKSHPTAEWEGVVFVWGKHGGADEHLRAANTPLPVSPELRTGGRGARVAWTRRALPYGYEVWLENALDAAHVVCAHHGIAGDRYNDPRAFKLRQLHASGAPLAEGLRYAVEPAEPQEEVLYEFVPPSLARIVLRPKGGASIVLHLYISPTSEGRATSIGTTIVVPPDSGGSMSLGSVDGLARFASSSVPAWALHIFGSQFLHQDLALLVGQQAALRRSTARDGAKWAKACYIPTPTDRASADVRAWIERAGGVPIAPPAYAADASHAAPPSLSDRRAMFDVWASHTKVRQGVELLLRF